MQRIHDFSLLPNDSIDEYLSFFLSIDASFQWLRKSEQNADVILQG